nr:hypothetical protein [Tanacetum cinerariifolium]
MVVFVVEKTIQDAKRIVQMVDLQHLCQTPDVKALPSERSVSQLASRGRLATVECFRGQPTQSYSKHDPEMVVFVVEKTIQDAKRIVQMVDLQHLCQTPDVKALPSER